MSAGNKSKKGQIDPKIAFKNGMEKRLTALYAPLTRLG
jgi:hypothetical protein